MAEALDSAVPQAPTPPPASKPTDPDSFYLGREYDLAAKAVLDRPVSYDAQDLTTHGVVVGMTGSGKTGLCINMLEEAALDGIPCILIDPKGDLTNLLLQFPELDPKNFLAWLNADDARQKGITIEEYACQLAEQWRKGLAEWGLGPEKVQKLRDAADYRIYTPGSEAGLPLSVLQTFAAPKGTINREALNQKIDATTTALLGLAGIEGDPVQSREHILLAQLLLNAWSKGQDLDLNKLITQVQDPPVQTIGAFDVDTFYPQKERLKLAVTLNNILAAPSFSTWINGEPLDLAKLFGDGPKPRHLIFYIAHLDDAQRMFFVTLLLEEVLNWTRRQTGTTSLRAILYFDEVFGYLPPHPANPPTKVPLMTLLKQARAFGVGVLLATQNPVDLDYKALSNAGTWFIGKLQTERDKARLVEGLQGVAAERGSLGDRAYLETVISALSNRVFLLHDVHRPQPVLFKTRHALSFLRGPLSRDQIEQLMQPLKDRMASPKPAVAQSAGPLSAIPLCPKCRAELKPGMTACTACATPLAATPTLDTASPNVPAGVNVFYLAPEKLDEVTNYRAALLGCAEVILTSRKNGQELRCNVRLLAETPVGQQTPDWNSARQITAPLAERPRPGARLEELPEALTSVRQLKMLEKNFVDFLYATTRKSQFENRKLGLVNAPDEDEATFRQRCQAAASQEAAKAVQAEWAKFDAKYAALDARLPEERPQPAPQATGGSSFFGKLESWWASFTSETITVPSKPLSPRDAAKLRALDAAWSTKKAEIAEKWRRVGDDVATTVLKPRKADIRVNAFGPAWVPVLGGAAVGPAQNTAIQI